jgi:hypothetical protein
VDVKYFLTSLTFLKPLTGPKKSFAIANEIRNRPVNANYLNFRDFLSTGPEWL